MRIQNIECQLAQGQLNRYLSGEALSETALTQLEAHVNECPDCQTLISDRKKALESVAQLPTHPTHAVVDIDDFHEPAPETKAGGSPVPRFLVDALNKRSETKPAKSKPISNHAVIQTERESAPEQQNFIKPLLYSIGLAGVLLAMTAIMKDPTRLFGDRAESLLPSSAQESSKTPSGTMEVKSETTAKSDPKATAAPLSGEVSAENDPKNLESTPTANGSGDDPMLRSGEGTEVSSSRSEVESEAITPKVTTPKTTTTSNDATKPAARKSVTATKKTTTRRATARRTPVRRSTPNRARTTARRPAPKPANRVSATPAEPKGSGVKVYDGSGAQVGN